MVKRLSELAVGERAVVKSVEGEPAVRRRLRAMGFVAGVEVRVRRCAPMGDPVAYDLLGYCLSLRREEAALVLVGPLPALSLLSAPAGARLRVLEVVGGWGMRRRLAALGVVESAEVMKVAGGDSGPFEIEAGGRRSSIGRGVAARVMVELAASWKDERARIGECPGNAR